MMNNTKFAACVAAILVAAGAFAQQPSSSGKPQSSASRQQAPLFNVKGLFVDSRTSEPLPFATVSFTRPGADRPSRYALTDETGRVFLEDVRGGKYNVKVELMGYKPKSFEIDLQESKDLGTVKVETDLEQLEAAKVSAIGNSIVVRKDTIEYNATSFKTTDNDVLEDLLKKLPGVEVSEDGSITVNGQEIKKITIDGKTFFLDDPQLASKNIPAKIVNKVKVVERKSDQAQFTGIDDGEEETVIDLSIRPGMMKGTFGNVMGGLGHDTRADGDYRYQGAAFAGKFTDTQQLSLVANANNTNNRGFNDLSGSMMGGMRGGGGGRGRGQGGWGRGNGITTSYMGGVNGAWTLLDGAMDLSGNYLYNNTDRDVKESSDKTTYMASGDNLFQHSSSTDNTASQGHRFGVRLDHKWNEQTSILFEPRVNFGTGAFTEVDTTYTKYGSDEGLKANESESFSHGDNRNVSTSGFVLLRQRLGAPGRTMTVMGSYNFSNNVVDGINRSSTTTFDERQQGSTDLINQTYNDKRNSASLWGRVTFTQPIWKEKLFVEANYSYSWNKSTSTKNTYDIGDSQTKTLNEDYSNSVNNEYVNQEIGANLMYQTPKFRAQLGFAAKPTMTHNTTRTGGSFDVDTTRRVVNWAPQGMLWWELSDNASFRMFYRGNSSQPSISKLISVPDNTNPLNVSFGNPTLQPSFNHSLRGDFRYNDKKTFTSVNVRFNGSYNSSPVVNATWYTSGISYSMPVNGSSSGSASLNLFANIPLRKTNFTIMTVTYASFNHSSNLVGTGINTSDYVSGGALDYARFFGDYDSMNFVENITNTTSIMERLRLTYRIDNLEVSGSVRSRMAYSNYMLDGQTDNTCTFNNQAQMTLNWTMEQPGITVKADGNYNWYNGYTNPQQSQVVLNAEVQKSLFKKKGTLALKCYDILGQERNLTVTDNSNYHTEAVNNTLGRYVILSFTYRFGNFDRSRMQGHGHMGR